MALIETRNISGKGLLVIPASEDIKIAKMLTVFVDVIRKPGNEYLNIRYNPPKSVYANISFVRDGYVIDVKTIEYERQLFDFAIDTQHQGTYAEICAYQGILDSFVNLGLALGLIPIQKQNDIKEWVHTFNAFEEIRVQCYADTLIRISVESSAFDICDDTPPVIPNPPPQPPQPPIPVPPGTPSQSTPFPVSSPYPGRENEQLPAPIDIPIVPVPPGRTCERFRVTVSVDIRLADPQELPRNFVITVFAFGDVGGLVVINANGNARVELECFGDYTFQECSPTLTTILVSFNTSATVTGANIVSIVPQ